MDNKMDHFHILGDINSEMKLLQIFGGINIEMESDIIPKVDTNGLNSLLEINVRNSNYSLYRTKADLDYFNWGCDFIVGFYNSGLDPIEFFITSNGQRLCSNYHLRCNDFVYALDYKYMLPVFAIKSCKFNVELIDEFSFDNLWIIKAVVPNNLQSILYSFNESIITDDNHFIFKNGSVSESINSSASGYILRSPIGCGTFINNLNNEQKLDKI
jgi:hypothetical protein